MATGYTAMLADKGQSFKDFVMGCARAFGPCISMRDASIDTPIPESFESDSHHDEALKEAQKLRQDLFDMTKIQRIEYGEKKRAEELARLNEWYRERLESNERLDDMESLVDEWTPPSDDHKQLKSFMLQQIDVSKDDTSYIRDEITKAEANQPIDYYKDAVESAEDSVKYHQKQNSKETGRVEFNNRWIKELRESLEGR